MLWNRRGAADVEFYQCKEDPNYKSLHRFLAAKQNAEAVVVKKHSYEELSTVVWFLCSLVIRLEPQHGEAL